MVDPLCFKIPPGYRGSRQEMLTSTLGGGYQDEDDAMLQMAIRQSMAESSSSGTYTINTLGSWYYKWTPIILNT